MRVDCTCDKGDGRGCLLPFGGPRPIYDSETEIACRGRDVWLEERSGVSRRTEETLYYLISNMRTDFRILCIHPTPPFKILPKGKTSVCNAAMQRKKKDLGTNE